MSQEIWRADQGDGSYRNPVLIGDYSDPDVIRVGDDFYLTSSSFANVPGLPILHSRDLVNWQLIGHALPRLTPDAHFSTPRRGGGVWAPTIRHHDGLFRIYFADPDHGVFVVTASRAEGPWTQPQLVDATVGAIDPAPFWDEDGRAWLVHAFAHSRAGISNIIVLKPMNAEGTRTTGPAITIIDTNRMAAAMTSIGPMPWLYTEGPKLYRRDGWYYVFAPSGGVRNGWQTVFRSRRITGPYEARVVLDQGNTDVNGPHQGAWVDTADGRGWFLHFQDRDSFGRVVHLQPLFWRDGWPVIGAPVERGRGEPVVGGPMPVRTGLPPVAPAAGDDFASGLSPAWQWQANPALDWARVEAGTVTLRPVPGPENLWETGNLLSQKLPSTRFMVTTRLDLAARSDGERAGLAMLGRNYGWVGIVRAAGRQQVMQVTRINADRNEEPLRVAGPAADGPVWLRMIARETRVAVTPENTPFWPGEQREIHLRVQFQYSLDGISFTDIGAPFETRPGRWVGAQFGLFAQAPFGTPSATATARRTGSARFGHVSVDPVD